MSPTKIGGVLSWAPDVDPNALEAAQRSANLPFVKSHVALMPDAHFGFGPPVGAVIPTTGAVMPYAVGVDIGCGMIAAKLSMTASQLPDDLTTLHSAIAKAVPAGMGQGHQLGSGPAGPVKHFPEFPATARNWDSKLGKTAYTQFGSLGSGNHFVELCLDENDEVWVVLHSGSRGVGNKLATQHVAEAKGLMKAHLITLEDPNLAYLVEGTVEFQNYISDMLWSQSYAMGNRQAMMDAVLDQVETVLDRPFVVADLINCHHNYCQKEHHYGSDVWLTRKGAIRARVGDRGVIPGSMGASTYIVEGLGNPSSYNSCSHGAGRRLSRTQAKQQVTVELLRTQMEGITWNGSEGMRPGNDAQLLDESPDAYKDIDAVMENQKDLVQITHKLHQVLNYKGS